MRGKIEEGSEDRKIEEKERRKLTRGLFNHEISLSDEKQGRNRDRDSWRASGKEIAKKMDEKCFSDPFKSG